MGCDISENYKFAGTVQGIKAFYDFLHPYSLDAHGEFRKLRGNEWLDKAFDLYDKFQNFIEEKYPPDNSKINKTHLGWAMDLSEIKESGEWASFSVRLDNRNSISAHIFKGLLDKYFPGVFMYYRYSGDSYMFNSYCSNDKDMRFFDHAPKGTFYLRDAWNQIGVLYDGYYTKEEIIDSYKLYLGNTDINPDNIPVFCGEEALNENQYPIEDIQAENAGIAEPSVEICLTLRNKTKIEKHGLKDEWKNVRQRSIDCEKYPELKDCPHLIGTKEDGTPYLYRAIVSDKSKIVRIPACLTIFDEKAFDFDVLFDSSYRVMNEWNTEGYTLILTEEQKKDFDIHEAACFFQLIKTESGEVIFEHPRAKQEDNVVTKDSAESDGFPSDIPF